MKTQYTKTNIIVAPQLLNTLGNVHRSNGFTLIEVLVSMLILAVGLLGIAALQFKGLKYSTDAAIRSNITILTYDIADKIRLNREQASSYLLPNYTVPNSRPTTCTQTSGSDSSNDLNCWYQLFWVDTNSSHVPPGTVVSITNAGATYTVGFVWTDRENIAHTINYLFIP